MAENKPKTYYNSISRAENMVGVSGVLYLLADKCRNRAEACAAANDAFGAELWRKAFDDLRADATRYATHLEEAYKDIAE